MFKFYSKFFVVLVENQQITISLIGNKMLIDQVVIAIDDTKFAEKFKYIFLKNNLSPIHILINQKVSEIEVSTDKFEDDSQISNYFYYHNEMSNLLLKFELTGLIKQVIDLLTFSLPNYILGIYYYPMLAYQINNDLVADQSYINSENILIFKTAQLVDCRAEVTDDAINNLVNSKYQIYDLQENQRNIITAKKISFNDVLNSIIANPDLAFNQAKSFKLRNSLLQKIFATKLADFIIRFLLKWGIVIGLSILVIFVLKVYFIYSKLINFL